MLNIKRRCLFHNHREGLDDLPPETPGVKLEFYGESRETEKIDDLETTSVRLDNDLNS